MVYDGAIYMHQGATYYVTWLDLDHRIAFVRPTRVKHYTSVRTSVLKAFGPLGLKVGARCLVLMVSVPYVFCWAGGRHL